MEHQALKGINKLYFRENVIYCTYDSEKIMYRVDNIKCTSINSIVSQLLLRKGTKSQVNCWAPGQVTYDCPTTNKRQCIGLLRERWYKENVISELF